MSIYIVTVVVLLLLLFAVAEANEDAVCVVADPTCVGQGSDGNVARAGVSPAAVSFVSFVSETAV